MLSSYIARSWAGGPEMNLTALTRSATIYPLVLILIVLALFLAGAPTGDAFSWPDAPRHALNGAFVLDLVRDHPFKHPTAYAFNYYAKYPALTILFYPPLFYGFLAAFYALFGVSQTVALAAEFVCYAALAVGAFRLARFWLNPIFAFSASLILIAAPETAYWGRQVMLEIPAFALVVWSAFFFMRHLREERAAWLYLAVALAVLAMYTKLTSAFILIGYLVLLLRARGTGLLRDRHSYIVGVLAIVSIVPLALMTLKFGQANVQSVSGIADAQVSRATLLGWLWYARQMPDQLGWPAFIAAVAGIAALTLRRARRSEYLPLLLWLVTGYLFFSAIDLKEARHSLFLLFPLAVLAVAGIEFLLGAWPRWAGVGAVAIGIATLCLTVFTRPVEYVAGYRELADYIAQVAPKNSVVVFSGYRDGSFIFAMRTHEERRDLSTVRSDKLLLRIAVRRSLGVTQKLMSEDEIAALLDRLGVQYVAAQPGFWTDLEAMRRFEAVLHSSHFREVRRFAMLANYPAQEKEIVVYRNLGHVAEGPIRLDIEIPMINRTVSGSVGTKN
jgi:4-amino-4-deoxy-L-arabinose transferase-like glycosyltransferase